MDIVYCRKTVVSLFLFLGLLGFFFLLFLIVDDSKRFMKVKNVFHCIYHAFKMKVKI